MLFLILEDQSDILPENDILLSGKIKKLSRSLSHF